MKKLLALLLILCMLTGLFACSQPDEHPDTDADTEDKKDEEVLDNTPSIVVPQYKDYGRESIDFSELVYARPDMQALISAFESAANTVKDNTLPIGDQISVITELEDDLSSAESMYSLAQIYESKDSSVEFWQKEYEYISTSYPRLSRAVEDLLVACALSEHRSTFEQDYFGYSLEEYADGGIYTDEVVALMEEEARLEAEYSALSTATVRIEYKGVDKNVNWSGTVDEVIASAREYYKNNIDSFERVLLAIELLYEKELEKLETPLFIELLKVRRLIADELGYSSYSELAYDTMGYDYSEGDMLELLSDIGRYVSPVAEDLEYTVFSGYFQTNPQPTVKTVTVINTLYNLYKDLGGDYSDAYSYMLQHGLYDVADKKDNRFGGAFTAYIEDNASPYLFMSASGFVRDYTTLSHEFGHFLDAYINYGQDESLAISEISSQALELLTLLELKGNIFTPSYEYLEYYTMFSFLNSTLLTQSFYAAFEHMAYDLEYDEISENKLNEIVEEAFSLVFGEGMTIEGDLSYVTITHTMLYPFYVESYVTSGIVSLDIFFAESYRTGKAGDGFKLYEALINRNDTDLGFTERLEYAGLDSPFKEGKVKQIANDLYFQIIGKDYYKTSDNGINAA